MDIISHEIIHFLLSLLAGIIVWRIYKKPLAAFVAAVLAGFFVDLDHFIDYFLAFGLNFRLDYFVRGYQFLLSDMFYILFHGWEYILFFMIIFILSKSKVGKTIFLSLALGLFFHLSADVFINHIPAKSYSITFRSVHHFAIWDLIGSENYQKHLFEKKTINLPTK
jgi:hypothetical protein